MDRYYDIVERDLMDANENANPSPFVAEHLAVYAAAHGATAGERTEDENFDAMYEDAESDNRRSR